MRLTLFLDHACNLACTYCYNGEKFARVMEPATARRAVDLVMEMPLQLGQVGFFGGEPMMRFPLIQEVTRYVEERTAGFDPAVKMVVTTNGTLLADQPLEWMKEHHFHLGISVDGSPRAHDACRRYRGGASSAADVEAGIRRSLQMGLPVKTISVIDPTNVEYLAESLDYLLGLGLRHLSFNINYEADWNDANRAHFTEALHEFTDHYVDWYRKGLAFRVNLTDSKIVTHVKGGYADNDRCDFGCLELAVSPSGKLYPCDRLIGEDNRDDVVIGDVWKGIDVGRRTALISSKNTILGECMECDLQHRCMHWCGCVNYAMTGSVGEVSGLLCWFEKSLIEEADRAAEVLYAEKNPAFIRRFYKFALGKD